VHGLLEELGFEIVEHRVLDRAAAARCATKLRGGNWGQGPYPTSGGTPASMLVALHYDPRPGESSIRERYPHLTNRDVLTAKEKLRALVNGRLTPERRCNPIHSSDSEDEAWEYLTVAMPNELSALRALIERRKASYRTPLEVLEVLSRNAHGKIEVVEYDGGLAVRKTVAPCCLDKLERELRLSRALADHPGIPPVLANGSNWIMRAHVHDRLRYDDASPTLIPLRILRDIVDILRAVHEAGYAIVRATPGSFRVDEAGVKLVNVECVDPYVEEPHAFHRSYTWHETSTESPGEFDATIKASPYEYAWFGWTGMSVENLCYASLNRQRYLRIRYRTLNSVRHVMRVLRRSPGRLTSTMHTRTRGIGDRCWALFQSWAVRRARASFGRYPQD
jgi:hypothetical protein